VLEIQTNAKRVSKKINWDLICDVCETLAALWALDVTVAVLVQLVAVLKIVLGGAENCNSINEL